MTVDAVKMRGNRQKLGIENRAMLDERLKLMQGSFMVKEKKKSVVPFLHGALFSSVHE